MDMESTPAIALISPTMTMTRFVRPAPTMPPISAVFWTAPSSAPNTISRMAPAIKSFPCHWDGRSITRISRQ
ncbi:hypothetical protein BMS3Bbin02_00027 [bacterium BMS3Bbin02]|nr:hypothetical protein BMS3Bbin02_00027 [bacterium BMS3Bbin02]